MVSGENVQIGRRLDPIWAERRLASEQDYAQCRQVMIAASRNYTFAGQFLPLAKRKHVEALYAFLRVGDDYVDVSHQQFESPEVAIDYWQRTHDRAFQTGTSSNPVMRAYLDTAITFGISREVMTPYFKAMRQDLSVDRYRTFPELLDYVAGSAMPVGRAMTRILGVRQPYKYQQALPGADALSIAMQLSNFLRDVGEDWQRGRIYLPQEDLNRFGVNEADLAEGNASLAFRRMLAFQVERTERYYQQARRGVPMLASGRWAVQSGLLIYRAIIESLRANNFDPFQQRARATAADKLVLVLRAWFQAR